MPSFMNYCGRLITYLESINAPLLNYLITFACLITLRNFLEGFSHGYHINIFFADYPTNLLIREFFHFGLAYVFIALLLILILAYFSQEKIKYIIKVTIPSFVIILSVPCIDLVSTLGKGHHITYLFPETKHGLLYHYFTFFGLQNMSLGMRLEILIVLLWSFIYLRNKQQGFLKSFLGVGSVYTAIFFVLITPYIFSYCSLLFGLNFQLTSSMASKYFLLFSFPLGAWIGYLADKKAFMVIVKDLRWLRLLHFELMLLLGLALAIKSFNVYLTINYIFLSISILFFWLFSVMTNNIADQDIDRISNPNRPLITKELSLCQYSNITYTILVCSLIYALAVNNISFYIILGVIFCYYIYSMPPLRLKRIPFFSKGIISLVSLAIVLLGYINIHGNWHGFPNFFIWFFILCFTFAANFIDIKDYAGDKKAKITTLSVLYGLKPAKVFIGVAFILASVVWYWYFMNVYLLALLLISGGVGFCFINQKDYQEWKVFSVYLSTMTILISYILMSNLCG